MKQPSIEVENNLLDLFQGLMDNNADLRINGCQKVLKILLHKQANENVICTDVKYCLERLVKGLGSSRDCTRLGFTLTLTQVIKHVKLVAIEDIFNLINTHITTNSTLENREIVFGQLFAYTALIRSGRLETDHIPTVVSGLFALCQRKSCISNAVYQIQSELFSQLSAETFKHAVWPILKEKCSSGWENSSADSLWSLLLALRMFPECCSSKYIKKHFNDSDIFSANNFDNLKRITQLASSSLPVLHPFCIELINIILSRKDFKDIWTHLFDENYFEDDQGLKRAFMGIEMVKRTLLLKPEKKIVKFVLSPKLCTVFLTSLFRPQHHLNSAANSFATFLCDFAKSNSDPKVQTVVLKALVETCYEEEKILPNLFKRIEFTTIVQSLHPDAIKSFCEFLKKISTKTTSDKSSSSILAFNVVAVVHQIASLTSHITIANDIEWRLDVVKFLFLNAFFHVKEAADLPHCDKVTEEKDSTLSEIFKGSFFKALLSLQQRSDRYHPTHEQYLQHLSSIIEYAEEAMSIPESIVPNFPLEKVQESWSKLKSLIHKMEKQDKKDDKTKETVAFKYLFLEITFHLFHESDFVAGLVDELEMCSKEALHSRKHVSGSTDDDKPAWICVLTDILLSIVSRPSNTLKSTVMSVFPHFCPYFTEEALIQILAVINPKSEDSEPILVDEDDDDEGEHEFESGSSDNSDIEDNNSSKVEDEFRNNLREALGPAADNSDAESVVLSDSEMFKLDEAIGKAFKGRLKSGHTQFSEEDQAMLNFRLKCLDLIISYLKSEPQLNLVLTCLEPLLSAYEYGQTSKHQKPLMNKSLSTLETLRTVKQFKNMEQASKSKVDELLTKFIERCHKEKNITVTDKLYSICVFLVLCSRKLEALKCPEKKSKNISSCVELYISALKFFVKDSNVTVNFFVSFMKACPDLAWNFVKPCFKYALVKKELRPYKRSLCLGILIEALKFSKNQSSITTDDWIEMGNLLTSTVTKELKDILESKLEIKPIYFSELLDILIICYTIVKNKEKQSLFEPHSDLLPLLCNMDDSQLKKLNKTGMRNRKNIILALGGTVPEVKSKAKTNVQENGVKNEVKRKRMSLEENSTDVASSKKKNKKKKSHKKNTIQNDNSFPEKMVESEDMLEKSPEKCSMPKIVNSSKKMEKKQKLSNEKRSNLSSPEKNKKKHKGFKSEEIENSEDDFVIKK